MRRGCKSLEIRKNYLLENKKGGLKTGKPKF